MTPTSSINASLFSSSVLNFIENMSSIIVYFNSSIYVSNMNLFYLMIQIFTLADVPGPPEKPATSDIDSTKITVTWSPPSVDGGSPVTGYTLERKEKTSTRWTKVTKETITETTLIVKDLIEGKEYEFRVAAVNKAGTGPFSEPSEPRITKPPYGK